MARTFNSGIDLTTLYITGSDGSSFSFSNSPSSATNADLLSFREGDIVEMLRRTPLANGGATIRRPEYKGVEGSFEIGRINGTWDAVAILQQLTYRQGSDPITYTIHATIQSRDGTGSISEYQWTNCTITRDGQTEYVIGSDTKLNFKFEGDLKVPIQ